MRYSKAITTALLLAVAMNVCAQGEVLSPLGARPVPEALNTMRKVDGLNTYFIYHNDSQTLPIADDFSIDRTRKRWARSDDAGVTLNQTFYHLDVAGVSEPDMVFSLDTTFTYLTDTVGEDTTSRAALPVITVTVWDLTVYPPTEEDVQAWPNYNVFDTVQNAFPDTLDLLTAGLAQDSLLVYDVAPDTRTYIRADESVVPLVLWEDDDVYVNGTYPIDPPTVGVATFDGLARTGYPYNFPLYSAYGIADHLTSVKIDLGPPEYEPSDSIYLSFFYQPQGLSGDNNVQPQDSLVLEFYAPDEQVWYRVWRTPYVPLQDFQQVLIPITHTRYFKPDFQFRFLNYATLSGAFDHWHLDYVRLGAQRTFDDTRLIDVAYVYPETSLLNTYTSVPFHKFSEQPASYMAQNVTASLKNLDLEEHFIRYGFTAKEENDITTFLRNSGLNTSDNELLTFPSVHTINPVDSPFIYNPALSLEDAFWRVKLWTNTTPDLCRYNDTVMFIQELSNYMSYDDGSAEMGYGLNVAGGRLAYRYDIVGGDSLRAVRMYFTPMANQPPGLPPTEGSFLITIWSSLDPVDQLYQNVSYSTPEYRLDGLNHFVEYALDETIYVEGTFYVGWSQTTTANMNLGFDRNRNNANKIFYSTTGGFGPTSFQGSLMMRPVFVSETDPFAAVEEPVMDPPRPMTLVPNPTNDAVRIYCEAAAPGATVQCMDATGRMVQQEPWLANRPMVVNHLNAGMYIVRLVDREGNPIAQERLLIQR